MLVKALTTAVLLAATLAAPQARADAALSATIVIARPPAIQVVHQGGHWHRPAYQHQRFARYHRPGKRHHIARHHDPRHHAAPARRHWGDHQPGQHAYRHGKVGRH
jgi:hypothetical protein